MLNRQSRYHSESDEQLVARFRNGESQSLGILFDRYSHLVIGVCLKYLENREAAKDAATDIFEQLMTKLKQHEVDRFRPWLYTLSRNHCLMQLRKSKRRPPMLNGHHSDPVADEFSLDMKRTEERKYEALENAIADLNSSQRQCIRLFYLEHLSYQQVSEKTGLDIKAVKSNIQNGKRNLKNTLTQRHGSEFE